MVQIQICSKYHLIIFLTIIIEISLKDRGDDFLHHGILNLSALLVFIVLGEIFIVLIVIIIKLIKNKRYVNLIILSGLIFTLVLVFSIRHLENYFCKDWDRSINGTHIDNNKYIYSCSIIIPKSKCLIDILSPFFDIPKFINQKCEKRKEKEKYLLKNNSKFKNSTNIKKIGYPNTISDKEELTSVMYSKSLYNFLKNNLINFDILEKMNNTKITKKSEVFLDYSKNEFGTLNININFNKELSYKRLQLSSNSTSNNIIFLFLDNLSRPHFYRQYKKTVKFLKNFFKYEGFSHYSGQKYHGFEFLKYHKFDGATLTNAIPMFSGVYFDTNKEMISIVKNLKQLGYITCNSQDVCHKELMGLGRAKKYRYIEFDHEYASPNCDPNIYNPGYGLFGGENGILRKCLYGKENIEYTYEYSKKFWSAYKNNKKFLRIVNTYAHEYLGEKSKYADEATYNFLYDLYNSNLIENTTIFLAGDHGFALMGIYKLINPNDWQIEKYLPIFIILIPDLKNTTYEQQYSEILKNQQTLITPFDIYYTIRHIIYGSKYKTNISDELNSEGESLFKYINPKERNCSKYKYFTECQCIINK